MTSVPDLLEEVLEGCATADPGPFCVADLPKHGPLPPACELPKHGPLYPPRQDPAGLGAGEEIRTLDPNLGKVVLSCVLELFHVSWL